MSITILHEDNHLLVVSKPTGVPSQPDSSGEEDMLTKVKKYIKEKYDKPGNVFVGLVHRLDRPTGGIMVFAKTSKGAARLSNQLLTGDFNKRYLAVTTNVPKEQLGYLEDYLYKDETLNIVRRVRSKIEGSKLAKLKYRLLERSEGLALIDVELFTGRSHQVRVQLAGIDCPIWGDAKYGKPQGDLALWAYQLSFIHPTTNINMIFKMLPPTTNPWQNFSIERYINIIKPAE